MQNTLIFIAGLGPIRLDPNGSSTRILLTNGQSQPDTPRPPGSFVSWAVKALPSGVLDFCLASAWYSPYPVCFPEPVKLIWDEEKTPIFRRDPFQGIRRIKMLSPLQEGRAWSPLFGWVFMTPAGKLCFPKLIDTKEGKKMDIAKFLLDIQTHGRPILYSDWGIYRDVCESRLPFFTDEFEPQYSPIK